MRAFTGMAIGKMAGAAAGFGAARAGNFAVMMGMAAGVLALSAGFGLNTAQLSLTRSNLLAALDSAVTSTARDLTTGRIAERDARTTVEAFLFANGGRGFAVAEGILLDRLEIDRTAKTVRAAASAEVDLIFPLFRTASTQRVRVESAALYSDKAIEVAMMLDLTTSMAPDNKLTDLKRAARNAVSTLLDGQDPTRPRVRVALVPYASSVNVGALAESSVFVERSMADRGPPPGSAQPRPAAGRPDNCATERKGSHQYTDAGPETAMVNRDFLLDGFSTSVGMRTCPRAALVPLSADADRLRDVIDQFAANGATAGHVGVQWAWYMLSEKWAGVVPAAARPGRANDSRVAKYAILMTDGEFNTSYFDANNASAVFNINGKAQTRDAARRLCREMRRAGIEIFTIGFKLENNQARNTMADCASPQTGGIRYHYDTSTGEELDAAFREIVQNIERLAITQ